MAENRLRVLSTAVWLVLAVASITVYWSLSSAGSTWVVAAAWSVAIALAHLISVPTPSGRRINLGIAPAVSASILLDERAALAAAIGGGLTLAWLLVRLRFRRRGREDGDFVAEALSMVIYGMVASVALQGFSSSRVEFTWVVLAAVVAGGFAWFVVRALVAALVGFERSDVSARYLWLLALEDWPVVVSILASATLFGLTWPDMGVWALLVAGMPYAFSHLAFVRYDSTRVTYGQTIRALAQIPEVAGLAPRGHSTRTAELALAIAREVGLHPKDVAELEYAALMHDVGRITLGEPAILKAGYTDEDIARWGAQIIAEAPYLARVAELVESQHAPYRRPGVERDPDVPMASKVIKIASAYDQSVNEMGLPPVEALELLHRGSVYEFDPLVAASLRRVLVHRGVIAA